MTQNDDQKSGIFDNLLSLKNEEKTEENTFSLDLERGERKGKLVQIRAGLGGKKNSGVIKEVELDENEAMQFEEEANNSHKNSEGENNSEDEEGDISEEG